MITYQLENWATYRAGCQALWEEHYDDIAVQKDKMPMRPDEEFYRVAEASGMLQIMVARKAGQMVGYALWLVKPHPHYADVLCAFEDSYYLGREWKTGLAGGVRLRALIQESLRAMKARGVKKTFWMTKNVKSLEAIFRSLGFAPSDQVFSLWIGG